MSSSEFSAAVTRAWQKSNKSRELVGLSPNKKPPRAYKVTIYLRPETYIDALAARGKLSLTKWIGETIAEQAAIRISNHGYGKTWRQNSHSRAKNVTDKAA